MAERTPVLAANWKMNKTIEETERYLAEFLPEVSEAQAEVVICPPYPSLKTAVEHCVQSRVRVAAQNMHEAESGAFTGEVSAPMLLELGRVDEQRLAADADAALERDAAVLGMGEQAEVVQVDAHSVSRP